jgi:hypothetical protein
LRQQTTEWPPAEHCASARPIVARILVANAINAGRHCAEHATIKDARNVDEYVLHVIELDPM